MRTRLAVLLAVPLLAVAAFLLADDAKKPAAGTDGVKAMLDQYAAALAGGNCETVAPFWTEDAEFTDEAGTTTRGRAAILAMLKPAVADNRGAKHAFAVTASRFPKPDVGFIDGTCTVAHADGGKDVGRFKAALVRTGDRWQLTSVWDIPDDAPATAATQSVAELKWLVGDWVSDDKAKPITLSVKPALDGQYLLFEYAVPMGDGAMAVVKYLGYDAADGKLRSWAFDSRGGHGSTSWERSGNTWAGETTGMLADGRTGTATHRIKYWDNDSFQYESVDRELGGQPVADASVKYTRKPK